MCLNQMLHSYMYNNYFPFAITDIDECAEELVEGADPVCFPEGIAICANTIPGFTCGCEPGYVVDSSLVTCIGEHGILQHCCAIIFQIEMLLTDSIYL